ncbi:AmmeMemoRadiSam system protein B [Pyrolobus fumarii]|uniref:AmmeMemoRadiSam system protein B n=1 Tax=Pyrolobus fumarii TaxID=54252 RepID=UPI003CC723CB
MVRRPAVAGMFYEADPEALRSQIEWCFTHTLGPGKLPPRGGGSERLSVGFVSPHAGYMYSGPVAAHVYYQLALEKKPDTVVIVGPNHTGLGTLVSVMVEGVWETPLGRVEIDSELAKLIVKYSDLADIDDKAHLFEHSVEVQVPFLQYIYGDEFRIVPIVMWDQTPRAARDLGEAVAKAAAELGRDVIYIASSDFTHYEPHEVAAKKDRLAIDKILALDPEGLHEVIQRYDISMCGPGPVMSMLYYARARGASNAQLLKYATSGDVTGDRSSVVGYAAIRVY